MGPRVLQAGQVLRPAPLTVPEATRGLIQALGSSALLCGVPRLGPPALVLSTGACSPWSTGKTGLYIFKWLEEESKE